jgi:hypothetical protein
VLESRSDIDNVEAASDCVAPSSCVALLLISKCTGTCTTTRSDVSFSSVNGGDIPDSFNALTTLDCGCEAAFASSEDEVEGGVETEGSTLFVVPGFRGVLAVGLADAMDSGVSVEGDACDFVERFGKVVDGEGSRTGCFRGRPRFLTAGGSEDILDFQVKIASTVCTWRQGEIFTTKRWCLATEDARATRAGICLREIAMARPRQWPIAAIGSYPLLACQFALKQITSGSRGGIAVCAVE